MKWGTKPVDLQGKQLPSGMLRSPAYRLDPVTGKRVLILRWLLKLCLCMMRCWWILVHNVISACMWAHSWSARGCAPRAWTAWWAARWHSRGGFSHRYSTNCWHQFFCALWTTWWAGDDLITITSNQLFKFFTAFRTAILKNWHKNFLKKYFFK